MRPRRVFEMCLLAAVGLTFSYGQAGPELGLTIHVYDYAGIEPGELAEAEKFAAGVLGGAGLGVEWRNCRFTPEGMEVGGCGAGHGVTHLYLRLLPELMAGKLAASRKMLGMLVPTSRGAFPVDAYVFAERVAVLAEEDRGRVSVLLGAAITHEVGHLLLAGDAHALTGVMSARWGAKEKKGVAMGMLTFSRRQSEKMRAEVGRRMRVE